MLTLALALAACAPADVYNDWIQTDGTVYASNASTPVEGLSITSIDYATSVTGSAGIAYTATQTVTFSSGDVTTASDGTFSTQDASNLSHDELVTQCTQQCGGYDSNGYCNYYYDDCWQTIESFSDSVDEMSGTTVTINYLAGSSSVATQCTKLSGDNASQTATTETNSKGKTYTQYDTTNDLVVSCVSPFSATASKVAVSNTSSDVKGVGFVKFVNGSKTTFVKNKTEKLSVSNIANINWNSTDSNGVSVLEHLQDARDAVSGQFGNVTFNVSEKDIESAANNQ